MNEDLISYLAKQKEEKYSFEDRNKKDLAYTLLQYIGDPNPVIRDELVYPNLAHLLHDNHLPKEELVRIAELLIGEEYLFFDMENKREFSSLKRSFTALQLVILLIVHNRDELFTESQTKEIFYRFVEYYRQEQDVRGYHKEVGWIHTIAHSADVFAQLFKCKELAAEDFVVALHEISEKFKVDHSIYISNEDERTVTALMNLLETGVLSNEQWIHFVEEVANYERPKTFPSVYNINRNVKHLLRSLYFRIVAHKQYQYLTNTISELLHEKVKTR